ncbi:nucleoside-diphosphate kinase [bacterium]|nr:nucleoside-diphosphate kinase [Chlamydiota bacterium]NDD99515.1 nucleoside-diphosphate kinase [bacterium]
MEPDIVTEMTLAIIKPDAVKAQHAGEILSMYEKHPQFKIRGIKLMHMDRKTAEGFYEIHRERPFFEELVTFMMSGPCIVMAIEGKHAVSAHRDFIGATNPQHAQEGTVRKRFGTSIGNNAVHGSDSPENGIKEVNYFFDISELVDINWAHTWA